MEIPGLGGDEEQDVNIQQQTGLSQTQIISLDKEYEWRFETAINARVTLKVIQGTAEQNGTDLLPSKPYTFQGLKTSVSTWTGCTLEVTSESGALLSQYQTEDSPLQDYMNVHLALESKRKQAELSAATGSIGAVASTTSARAPILLILGPDHAGKTTLAKTLTSYAIREGRAPTVVGLDPSESIISLPGTLTATVFKTMLEIESDCGGGWGTSPMSGPNGEIPVKMPLVYYTGSMDPIEKGGALWQAQVHQLALVVQGRISGAGQQEVRFGGVVVDTPGSLVSAAQAGMGYPLVEHIVSEFGVDCIICLGSERLYSDMVRRFDKQIIGQTGVIGVTKLQGRGGAVDRDAGYMAAIREAQIKSYFYGSPRVGSMISLQPRVQQLDLDVLPTVWRRIGNHATSMVAARGGGFEDDFRPGGDESEYEPLSSGTSTINGVPLPESQLFERLARVVPALKYCLLAVLNCPADPEHSVEQDTLRDSSCMGFLYVTEVDEAKGKITVLSPVGGRIPSRALVWSESMEGVMGIMG